MDLPSIKRIVACSAFISFITRCSPAVMEHKNWAFHFPYGSNMGLYLALALPIEVPNENVFVAYNFEANYLLPANESEVVQFPPLFPKTPDETQEDRHIKNMNRNNIYKSIETKMKSYGYSGRYCLLNAICEASSMSFEHNGILGDIIHIILTPSSSSETGLLPTYLEAEKNGRKNNCSKYKKKCPDNFKNLMKLLLRVVT